MADSQRNRKDFMPLSTYIRDKNTGQAYQLQPSGYYKQIAAPGQGAVDVNNLTDIYSQNANEQLSPYYDTAKTNATAEGTQTAKLLADKVGQEFSNKGLLRSGMYGDTYTAGQAGVARDTSARLSDLERARNSEFNSLYNTSINNQRVGEQQDIAQANLEADRKYKAEQDAIAETRAKELQDYQLKLLNAQIASYAGGGGGTTGATVSRAGNSDNILVDGQPMTREDYATILANTNDRNSAAWKKASAQVYKEYPSLFNQTPAQPTPVANPALAAQMKADYNAKYNQPKPVQQSSPQLSTANGNYLASLMNYANKLFKKKK